MFASLTLITFDAREKSAHMTESNVFNVALFFLFLQ